MIEGRNIICIASNWWYDPTSKHHVMKLLAERNHVVWVNYHCSRRPRVAAVDARAIAGKLRQFIDGPRQVEENITVVTPMVIPLPGSRAAANLNRRLLSRQIKSVLRSLPPRPVQLWTFAPDVDYLAGRFGEECVVYYCVDEFSEFAGYDRDAILAAEAKLAARADLVITTSTSLYQAKRRLSVDAILVTHGVDYDNFAGPQGETPAPELAEHKRPILGFWGLIQDWVDTDLIAAIARLRPDWSVVLIGEALADTTELARVPNVHLLGRRPYAHLPAYAAAFDVGIIPFRINNLTRAVNPIKLREYLSAGLPVVSTPLPEVQRYEPWVMLADSPERFVVACERAIETNSASLAHARRERMLSETWRSKVEGISDHLRRVLSGTSSAVSASSTALSPIAG